LHTIPLSHRSCSVRALLLWPAAINGYPLVFSDTGTCLSQAIHHYLGWDRPIFYNLFLLPLHLVRRALLPLVSTWWLLPLLAAVALVSALPWLVSQLMPDLFTGPLVLALGLLAFAAASQRFRRLVSRAGLAGGGAPNEDSCQRSFFMTVGITTTQHWSCCSQDRMAQPERGLQQVIGSADKARRTVLRRVLLAGPAMLDFIRSCNIQRKRRLPRCSWRRRRWGR
jgi:hypothetical protein